MKTITVIFYAILAITIVVDFGMDVAKFKKERKYLRRKKSIIENQNFHSKAVFEAKSLEYKEGVGRNLLLIVGAVWKVIIYIALLLFYIFA